MKHRLGAALFASLLTLLAAIAGASGAENFTFFRIGTGGGGGTYYPVGGMVAHAISHPPGSRACEDGGDCGVPGLIALGQSSRGSVDNIEAIATGKIESGFVQSDIAYWAYNGTGIFAGKGRITTLRAITNLYPESIHLVARRGAGIDSVADLRGKRVALDERGSGTLVDARLILQGYGIGLDEIHATYIKSRQAVDEIKRGRLDAFFMIAGYPVPVVEELASSAGADLIPIIGPQADKIVRRHGFLFPGIIPAETYTGIPETATLAVSSQWVTREDVDAQLVYDILSALWNDTTRRLLDDGHAKGRAITLETALQGIAIPLHPGAERYYRMRGLVK
jgi:TRAP transporter TAXI family solute receptor